MKHKGPEKTAHDKGQTMNTVSSNTVSFTAHSTSQTLQAAIQQDLDFAIEDLMASLPDPKYLSADHKRGIIARYTAVLEGNFIYWMTGAYLAVASEEARLTILDNLHEEVHDSHPRMLRKFALAAHAIPTDTDAISIHRDLTNVRLFVGRLAGVRIVIMMAFFEGFIQRFMSYLAELAEGRGSVEFEYTDVHGVCDVAHTQGLFGALAAEMELDPPEPTTELLEGVDLLRTLIQSVIDPAEVNRGQPLGLALRAHTRSL